MKGRIEDLAFSHCRDKIYLAVIDVAGTLFVFNIRVDGGGGGLYRAHQLVRAGGGAGVGARPMLGSGSKAPLCLSLRSKGRGLWPSAKVKGDDR